MNNSETLEVTIKYGGMKGEWMSTGATSQADAVRTLIADLLTLRAHRPKSENIRQAGATFFLSWHKHANARFSLVKGSLYPRWQGIVKGSPELNTIKQNLSIESVTLCRRHGSYSLEVLGPAVSPLGPKHTIERSRTEGMSSRPPLPAAGHSYCSQQPVLAAEVTQGKRPRSNSIPDQSHLGSEGNDSSAHLQKKIRMEQCAPIRDDISGETHTLGDTTSQVGNISPQSRPPTFSVPPSTTHRRELRIPPSTPNIHSKPGGSPGASNGLVSTRPCNPGDQEATQRLSVALTKVRSELVTLQNCEKALVEELSRRGVSPQPIQPKNDELTSSLNDLQAQLMLVEIELQQERIQRLRAEHVLGEVEKECKTPFVVPALFQAFRKILDVGRGA